MKNNLIHTPHDKLFRSALQYPEVAKEFLQMCLPHPVRLNINYNTVTYCSTTFIDAQLNLSQADVLFKAQIYENDAYIYILAEQESEIDNLISYWMMKYMMSIWDHHIKTVKEAKALPLPMIVPLVFYTGDRVYSAPLELWKLFGQQDEAMKGILQAPLHLIEVGRLPEKELTSNILAGTMAFMLRKYFRKHIVEELEKIIDNINTIGDRDLRRYLLDLMRYTFGIDEGYKNKKELLAIIHDKASTIVEETMSSLADEFVKTGMEKGMKLGMEKGMIMGVEKGITELIVKMLDNGVDPAFINKNTGVPLYKIKKIQNKEFV